MFSLCSLWEGSELFAARGLSGSEAQAPCVFPCLKRITWRQDPKFPLSRPWESLCCFSWLMMLPLPSPLAQAGPADVHMGKLLLGCAAILTFKYLIFKYPGFHF